MYILYNVVRKGQNKNSKDKNSSHIYPQDRNESLGKATGSNLQPTTREKRHSNITITTTCRKGKRNGTVTVAGGDNGQGGAKRRGREIHSSRGT